MTTTITQRVLDDTEAFAYLDRHLPALLDGEPLSFEPGDEFCIALDELNGILARNGEEPLPVTCDQFSAYLTELVDDELYGMYDPERDNIEPSDEELREAYRRAWTHYAARH